MLTSTVNGRMSGNPCLLSSLEILAALPRPSRRRHDEGQHTGAPQQRSADWAFSYKVCQSTTDPRWHSHSTSRGAISASKMDTGPWYGLRRLCSKAYSVLKSEHHIQLPGLLSGSTRVVRGPALAVCHLRIRCGALVLAFPQKPGGEGGGDRCLSTTAPLLVMVLSLFAHGLNDRIVAVSRLRTTGS